MSKKQVVDYNRGKNIQNPYGSKKKKKKGGIAWKRVFKTLFLAAVVGGVGWFLLFCSIWNVKSIEVKGTHRVSAAHLRDIAEEQTQKKKFFFLHQQNLLLFNRGEVKKRIQDQYHFPEINIDKDIPNKIVVTIAENQCRYIFKQDNSYYKVDRDNDIIEKTGKLDPEHPMVIENKLSTDKIYEGQIDLDEDYLDYVIGLQEYLNKKKTKLKIQKILLDEPVKKVLEEKNTVKMVLKSGPVVHMSMGRSPQEQLDRLLVLKDKELNKDFSNKKYIILKHGKIFYK